MGEVEQNKRLAYIDDLTGLYNRRYFREKLLEEKRKADKKGSSFGLAMIDLDGFKPINDTYGHLTGDRVLSQVGELLKGSLRPSDVLCRYAGDEFVVIFPEVGEDDLIRVAERIKENLAGARWRDEKGESIQPVTCSLGYSFYSEKGKDLNELISWADQALYCAKRRGGNGHCGDKDLPKESTGRPLMHTPHIVGREKELRRLKSLLEQVHGEEMRLILIHGEAGAGKTRLMRELRQVLERRGGIALVGNCHEETRSIPYYPLRDAFNRFFDEKKEAGFSLLKDLPEYSQRELARILPGLKEMKPSELERAPDSFRLFEAIRLLLRSLSGQSGNPLLFVVDDLQWSDDASLDLLHYLARNLGETRVLLCGTYRTEEKEASPGLLRFAGLLRREKLSEEMFLESLSAKEVSTMLRLLCPGKETSEEFQDFLYEKTEGNPFFVEELVKFLGEEGIGEGLPRIREVPLSIYAVLQRRMDSLAPGMKEILACAALVGKEFEFEVLHRVQDRPQREILGTMDAAVKARIIRESFEGGEERYHFVHSLLADVLHSGVGKVRRRLLHRQVGEALEEFYAGRLEQLNGRLVYHFERGEKWEKALNYSLRSARQAKDDYANQEAIRFYTKAREMLPRLTRGTEDEAAAIAEELGDTYQITGDYDKALEEYKLAEEAARRKGDEKKEGDALSKMSLVHGLQGNYNEMMSHAERSYAIREQMGDHKGLAESLRIIGNVHANRGDYGEALSYLTDSLRIRQEIDDQTGAAASLGAIGAVHWQQGDYEAALRCDEESLKIRRDVGDKPGMAASLNSVGIVHWSRGDYEAALKCHKESMRIRRETGDKRGTAGSLTNIGNVYWGRGEYGEALKCHEESLKIDREIGSKTGIAAGLTNIGNIHFARGAYGEALRHHEESLEVSKEIGDKRNVALSLANMGDVHIERGEYEDALKSYEESLGIQEKIGDKPGSVFSMLGTGNIHQALYDFGKAMEHHKESYSLIEKLGMKAEKTAVLTRMGMNHHLLGDDEMALEHLNKALELVEEFGTKEAEPGVLSALGEVWLSKGDLAKTREFCGQLMTVAEKEGLKKYLAVGRKLKGEILLPQTVRRQTSAVRLREAEAELRDAQKIAEEIGAQPLLWQIHATLGRLYAAWSRKGDKKKASEQFAKAHKIIKQIASKIGDQELKKTFLNSKQVRAIGASI